MTDGAAHTRAQAHPRRPLERVTIIILSTSNLDNTPPHYHQSLSLPNPQVRESTLPTLSRTPTELRARRKDAAPSTPAAADRNVHQGHGGERQGCRSAGTSSSPALRSEGQDRRAQKGDVGSAATAAAGNERATASVAAGKGKDRGRWPERRGAPSAAAFGWWNEGTASP